MGTDHSIACRTCKVEYYLGYGGSGSGQWYSKKFPASDHDCHEVEPAQFDRYPTYSTDYLRTHEDGHLWFECPITYSESLFLENYRDYKFITFDPPIDVYKLNGTMMEEFENNEVLGLRILQGDPSLQDEYKQHKYFDKWISEEGAK